MLESEVEKYLVKRCEANGCLAEKHTSPGRRGPPDRLITLTWGAMDLVETKKPGESARVNQVRDHEARAKRGVPVYLLDTKEKVDIYEMYRIKNGRHVPRLFSVPLENDPHVELQPEPFEPSIDCYDFDSRE